MRCSVLVILTLLVATSALGGLEERWHVDLSSAARSIPLAADLTGDGASNVVVTTRFDGTLWVFEPSGSVVRHVRHPQWLEGSAAAVSMEPSTALVAYQESAGRLNLTASGRRPDRSIMVSGDACIGTAPCFGDLNNDGAPDLVVARRGGVVSAFDKELTPLWQFDVGTTIDSSPAVAPVFETFAGVYVFAADGTLHCLAGDGRPLWQFHTIHAAPRFPALSDPLVVQLAEEHPTVLVSDAQGWLYAVDAVEGCEQWGIRAGVGPIGTPAIVDPPSGDRMIITLDETGKIAAVSQQGALLEQGALPEEQYVPRPLVADVDGDGSIELLAPNRNWKLVIASLDGTVKEEIPLRGNVKEGAILVDLDQDGLLELVAATECGRIYCFATKAREGWTHPRANFALNGCVLPLAPPPPIPPAAPAKSRALIRGVYVTAPAPEERFANAVISFKNLPKGKNAFATVVIRQRGRIVGSAVQPLQDAWMVVPFIGASDDTPEALSVEATLSYPGDGKVTRASHEYHPAPHRMLDLAGSDAFLEALSERGKAYKVPSRWALPEVSGRDSWHVARFAPEEWRTYGIADLPFIAEAIPRVWASAASERSLFQPGHPTWSAIAGDTKPFFLMNDYFRPEVRYPDAAYQTIIGMARDRFLGFPVHEWAYRVWKESLEGAAVPPATREAATAILKQDFDYLLQMCHGRIYEGEGYCLFHHHAFAWGAPLGYVEVGENIPCAQIQFAFIRGAARQYGGRPWGAYLSNWFRGAVLDSRYRPPDQARITWSPPDMSSGPDCGHSPSLEFRLEMAAHLAGATFVHHESDAYNGSVFVEEIAPGKYRLSSFGNAMSTWFEYARQYPDRGIPYTPIAFMLDWHHGWRPREDIYGIWPQQRSDRSIEAMFRHAYAWGDRLDFERGYLAYGPYGDIFDVVTNTADAETLQSYGVLWPLGDVHLDESCRRTLLEYVRNGGILVLDSALARAFPDRLLGVRFANEIEFATGALTDLINVEPPGAPFRYRPIKLNRAARPLAWSETGAPLLAWNSYGKGLFVIAATDHWMDERDAIHPLVPVILESLADAFLPVRCAGELEMLLNRTGDGWLISLVNNHGVEKVPTLPATIDPKAAHDALLLFRDQRPIEFHVRMGRFVWSNAGDGLLTRVQPGHVAIVEVKLSAN